MKRVPLMTSESVVADSTGTATTNGLGPNVYGLTWEVNLITVSNDGVNQSECDIYLNAISPSYRIGGTWSGNKDSNSDTMTLQCGDKLIAQWTGADSGSNCLILVSGTVRDIR